MAAGRPGRLPKCPACSIARPNMAEPCRRVQVLLNDPSCTKLAVASDYPHRHISEPYATLAEDIIHIRSCEKEGRDGLTTWMMNEIVPNNTKDQFLRTCRPGSCRRCGIGICTGRGSKKRGSNDAWRPKNHGRYSSPEACNEAASKAIIRDQDYADI